MNTLRPQADEEIRAADMGISGPDEITVSFSKCLQQLLEECSPEMIDESLLRLLREIFQTERVSFYRYASDEKEMVLCAETGDFSKSPLPPLLPSVPLHRLRIQGGGRGINHSLLIHSRLPFSKSLPDKKSDGNTHSVMLDLWNTTQLWGVICMESHGYTGRKSQVELLEYYRGAMPLFTCQLQNRVNRSLQKKLLETESSARRKMAFLANMSHDIRTPLNAIVGFSKLLAETDEITERLKYFSIIEKNNELLLQLISDILDLSKIEAGTISFRNTITNLNDCFTTLIESANSKLGRHVVIDFLPALPVCYILTDPNRLMQVIGNFLNNALKFTSVGVIRMGWQMDGPMLELYVEDSGIGIPQAELETIFNPYVRLNTDFTGTGLGLAICKSIIEKMQGTIGASSQLGVGSRFWCKIPYQPLEQ